MTSSTPRPERTITVETEALGAVKVRRISLGGMARIAERMRAEGSHDETALGEALVAEVVVAGLDDEGERAHERGPDEALDERLARLSDEDRRSIAAAVLTLEGVKGTGDGVLEDPRATLARRYSRVLETQRHRAHSGVPPADGDADPGAPRGGTDGERGVAQIALFEDLLAPTPAPLAAAAPGEPARAPAATRSPAAWERERATLQADIADLEALLAQQAEQRETLEASVAAAGEQVRAAQRTARLQRWLAAASLALVVVVGGAQFAWIGMLRNDIAEQRAQFEARLQAQQKALEDAQRDAEQANARAQQLATRRAAPTASTRPSSATKGTSPTRSSATRASPAKSSPAKSPPAKAPTTGTAAKP